MRVRDRAWESFASQTSKHDVIKLARSTVVLIAVKSETAELGKAENTDSKCL